MDILMSRKVIFVGDMVYKAIGFIAKRWAIFAAIFIYTTGTQHDKTRQGTTRDTTTAGGYSLFFTFKINFECLFCRLCVAHMDLLMGDKQESTHVKTRRKKISLNKIKVIIMLWELLHACATIILNINLLVLWMTRHYDLPGPQKLGIGHYSTRKKSYFHPQTFLQVGWRWARWTCGTM